GSDAMTPEGIALIEERFGIPVLGRYGAIEALKIGYTCEAEAGSPRRRRLAARRAEPVRTQVPTARRAPRLLQRRARAPRRAPRPLAHDLGRGPEGLSGARALPARPARAGAFRAEARHARRARFRRDCGLRRPATARAARKRRDRGDSARRARGRQRRQVPGARA